MIRALAIVLMSALCLGTVGIEPMPPNVSFQGRLLQADGNPIADGPRNLEFRLYANKNDDTPVWAELQENIQVISGAYVVQLGGGAELSGLPHQELAQVMTTAALWLGVTVQGEAEQAERLQFTSAPYALTTDIALYATHGTPPGTIAMWSSSTAPEGWLLCDGHSYTKEQYPRLYQIIMGDAPGTSFTVPNFGGRALLGAMAADAGQNANSPGMVPAVAGLTPHAVGDLLGEELHVVTLEEMARHQHGFDDWSENGEQDTSFMDGTMLDDVMTSETRTSSSAGGIDANSAAPHNNMQPSVAVFFIIKY